MKNCIMLNNKKFNCCTLFDSNYLTRGLALYESLKKHSNNFSLYIFTFDDKTYSILKKMNLDYVTVIPLSEFEDPELLSIKSSRTRTEYCWTCTPATILYCINKFKLTSCTYLDADLYFYSDPYILIDEMHEKSILITEHRYTPRYDQSLYSGIYCVQFMTFKNTISGIVALEWWRDQCINWCYNKFEDGKFGDQKYLDDWPVRFKEVHISKNLGAGIAPWNVQQYDWSTSKINLIFYHFHNFKIYENNFVDLGNFKLNKLDINLFYKPYTMHLLELSNRLSIITDNTKFHSSPFYFSFNLSNLLLFLKRKIKGVYNIYNINKL